MTHTPIHFNNTAAAIMQTADHRSGDPLENPQDPGLERFGWEINAGMVLFAVWRESKSGAGRGWG
jgi:hypothetical protein